MKAEEFFKKNNLSMQSILCGQPTQKEKNFQYLVTLTLAGKGESATFDFFKGSAHIGYQVGGKWVIATEKEKKEFYYSSKIKPIPPQIEEFFYCLGSDCRSIHDNPIWEDWANEFCYNVDSIKDKKVFEKCTDQYLKCRRFFGRSNMNDLMSIEDE